MSRGMKVVLAVIVVAVVGCGLLAVLGTYFYRNFASSVVQNEEDALALAAEIVDFEPPPGYTPEMGFDLMGTKMVVFSGPEGVEESAILLAQGAAGEEEGDQIAQLLEDEMSSRFATGDVEYEEVSRSEITVRDQPATMIVREGRSSAGAQRQVQVGFEGKGGPAIMLIFGPVSGWDQAAVDDLLASMR